jgi:hypothetical protein
MPSRLKRYQQTGQLHYITFTCYRRLKHLETNPARDIFEQIVERVRRWYRFQVVGYVVMPEHVHLLISEPERSTWQLLCRCSSGAAQAGFASTPGATACGKNATMTSTCSARASGPRSCVTCIAIRGPRRAAFWLAGVEAGEAWTRAES